MGGTVNRDWQRESEERRRGMGEDTEREEGGSTERGGVGGSTERPSQRV